MWWVFQEKQRYSGQMSSTVPHRLFRGMCTFVWLQVFIAPESCNTNPTYLATSWRLIVRSMKQFIVSITMKGKIEASTVSSHWYAVIHFPLRTIPNAHNAVWRKMKNTSKFLFLYVFFLILDSLVLWPSESCWFPSGSLGRICCHSQPVLLRDSFCFALDISSLIICW